MMELILKAQSYLDKDDLEGYEKVQIEIRNKYIEEEGNLK